jgi:hypothetical protein
MADDTKGPLEASVGEQLQAKARLEEASGAERREDDLARERIERHKADEQATVLEHTGGEHRVAALREASMAAAGAGAGAGAGRGGGADAAGSDAGSSASPRDLLAVVRGLPPKGLAAIAGALVLLNGRRRRGRLARFLVPLGAASFVLALRRGWAPAALGAR